MTSADTKLGLLNSTSVLHIRGISHMKCEVGNRVSTLVPNISMVTDPVCMFTKNDRAAAATGLQFCVASWSDPVTPDPPDAGLRKPEPRAAQDVIQMGANT